MKEKIDIQLTDAFLDGEASFFEEVIEQTSRCAAEPRSYHITGGIPVE